jgi:ergothioneine biosynthesis protein EgtB
MTTATAPTTAALLDRLLDVRAQTERLAAPLSAEDQTVQSMPDVSPTKWHRAHTSWFFETFLLEPRLPGYHVFHPSYGFLFNSYYEALGPRHARPERGLLTRPGIDDIARYRAHVDAAMGELLDGSNVDGVDVVDLATLVELGVQHEQQHQELLLMDIKHVLSCNPLLPTYDGEAGPVPPPMTAGGPLAWTEHPGGTVEVGHGQGGGFAFDNELPRHAALLQPFAIAERPVSCGEWLAFVDDGGYQRPDLWLSEGWGRVQAEGWRAPLYWVDDGDGAGGGWTVFTLRGPTPIDEHAPVCHVSYFEADAFARWSGARLPTEFEWEAAAPAGAGAVWEWTASSYAPYPGFQPAAGAVGEYNGKFMVNQYVLRGGCCATPAGHARTTYRNFFPASARWAFSGLRLAR